MCQIPKDRRQLTKALHGYPKKHGLTIEWVANELWNQFDIDIAHSTLERYLNPNDDPKLPADLVGPICRICNNDFSALDHITTKPKVGEVENEHVAIAMKEVGEATAKLSQSLMNDGRIDHIERPECTKEVMEAIDALKDILAMLIK